MENNFYDRIFKLECSMEELEEFSVDMDNFNFDDNNSFERFFNLKIVINAIQKYKNGQIDERFLAYWANIYNWIIMASEWKEESIFDFASFIKDEIAEALDSLSFFEDWFDDPMCNDLDAFIRGLRFYDNILKNIDEYEVFYRPIEGGFSSKNDVYIVAVNKKEKRFVKFREGTLSYEEHDVGTKLNIHTMASLVKQLKSDGYEEIK